MAQKLILIDNYDSFTYNLYHFLGELGAETTVYRNDKIDVEAVASANPDAIILSPGPCTPDKAGICLELVEKLGPTYPILGVCLGHQAIGQVYGGKIIQTSAMHGKLSAITHQQRSVFTGVENGFKATRYHSLTIERETFPDCLEITAQSDDGVIMGLQHRHYNIHGVQFHPESIATEHGHQLLKTFLELAAK
jgi:anthranilate synthase component II